MEGWSPESRSAVQDAFNALRQTIGRELESEVERRVNQDGRSRALLIEELEILKSRSAEVDRLEEENRKLRTKLLQFHQQSRATEPRDTPRPSFQMRDQATNTDLAQVDSSSSSDADQGLRETQKLYRKYNALDQNFKRLKAEYYTKRDEIKEWKAYAEELEAKIKTMEEHHGQLVEPADTTQATSEPSRPQMAAASSFTSDLGDDQATTDRAAGPSKDTRTAAAAASTRDDETQDLPPANPSEGETTEGAKDIDMLTLPPLKQTANATTGVHIKPEPSSDGPVFVSERHVGKRKHSGDSGSEQLGRRIKLESPGPSATALSSQPEPESMDLDEVGQKLSTPRKNRVRPPGIISEPGQMDVERAKTTDTVFVRPDHIGTPAPRPSNTSAVLTPVNPNARTSRLYERKTVEKQTKKGLAQGIGTLAEDGLVYKKSGRGGPEIGQFRTPQPPGRLSALLNAPSPEQAPAIVRSAPRPRDVSRLEEDEPLFPERRALPFTKERREKPRGPPSHRKELDETAEAAVPRGPAQGRAAAVASSKASLRSKPVASLRLDDFKINPKFNGGSDYAYSEVVRGKDDRACLPGCTDMDCCGKHFRAMALAQKNNVDRTPASDNKLFEDYLGDRISTVWGMSRAEKDELWVEAKTWQLANELGKHRHRYARRSSPPGFWNADFPNTQEVQAEKAEAEKREKQMIQERYRDAVRGGGRWVFRDE